MELDYGVTFTSYYANVLNFFFQGNHDLLYQEFLPLLPNLLQGTIENAPVSFIVRYFLKLICLTSFV